MNEVKDFQIKAAAKLKSKLNLTDENVDISWPAFAGHGRRIYQPLVDIAMGPFAIGHQRYEMEYDNMVNSSSQLIDEWVKLFMENWGAVIGRHYWVNPPDSPSNHEDFIGPNANWNARCFIAIEIENATTRKHWMGSIVNAGALGRIGILVAWRDEVLRAAIRMREYFRYLQEAGKPTFNMSGVVILTKEQLADSLGIKL